MKKKIRKLSSYKNYDEWASDVVGSSAKQVNHFLRLALKDFEKDGDVAVLLLALRQIAKAKSGFAEVSSKAGLTREALYKILSKSGNPTLTTFSSILSALGYCLSIKSVRKF